MVACYHPVYIFNRVSVCNHSCTKTNGFNQIPCIPLRKYNRIMLDTTVCLSDRKFTKPTVKYRTHGKTYRLYSIHLFQFLIERKQRKGATPYFYCIFVMVCTHPYRHNFLPNHAYPANCRSISLPSLSGIYSSGFYQ